jgi:hypothetical protein
MSDCSWADIATHFAISVADEAKGAMVVEG